MKVSLAAWESRRRLHPHPRVTAVAKNTATAAPLALSCNQRARDLKKALKAGAPVIFQFRVNYRGRFEGDFFQRAVYCGTYVSSRDSPRGTRRMTEWGFARGVKKIAPRRSLDSGSLRSG